MNKAWLSAESSEDTREWAKTGPTKPTVTEPLKIGTGGQSLSPQRPAVKKSAPKPKPDHA